MDGYMLGAVCASCPIVLNAIRTVRDCIGEEKLLWGGDSPGTLSGYEYWQMVDSILRIFPKRGGKALAVGGSALQLFWN